MNNIQETPSKKTRGGARKGAGRPRTIAKQITIGIPQDALEIFQQQPNKKRIHHRSNQTLCSIFSKGRRVNLIHFSDENAQ